MASDEIINGMASALWATAWASNEEEQGRSVQGEITDLMPPIPDEAAQTAKWLSSRIENDNGVDLLIVLKNLVASGATRSGWIGADEEAQQTFGHYLAMEALGTGVSWRDDHEDHGLKLPSIEFYIWDCNSVYPSNTPIVERLSDIVEYVADMLNYDIGSSPDKFAYAMDAAEDAIKDRIGYGWVAWSRATGSYENSFPVIAAERHDDGSVTLSAYLSLRDNDDLSKENIRTHFVDPYTTEHDIVISPVVMDQVVALMDWTPPEGLVAASYWKKTPAQLLILAFGRQGGYEISAKNEADARAEIKKFLAARGL